VARIFREDELVLEAQQRALDEHPERGFYDLNIDAGAVWARKLIDSMIDEERARSKLVMVPHAAGS
jgi:vanillate O-demethylase monooxygenase subunit